MVISGFDYQMYQDEIAELREEMTQLLLSMEGRRGPSPEILRMQGQDRADRELPFQSAGRGDRIPQNEEGRSHRAALWSR